MLNALLRIDTCSLGEEMQLVNVTPDYYANGERQATAQGHKYEVCLPAHRYDKLTVRIGGHQRVDAPATTQTVYVQFANLAVKPYVDRSGRLALSATADDVKIVKGPNQQDAAMRQPATAKP